MTKKNPPPSKPTEEWLGLVHKIVQDQFEYAWSLNPRARKIRVPIDYDDLFQEGCAALSRARQYWDPDKAGSFKTYAYQCIRRGVKAYVDKQLSSPEWRVRKFSELTDDDTPLDILDPGQDDEVYNILHADWVRTCIDRIRFKLGCFDFNILMAQAHGSTIVALADHHGVSVYQMKRYIRRLKRTAYYAIKDQEDLLG